MDSLRPREAQGLHEVLEHRHVASAVEQDGAEDGFHRGRLETVVDMACLGWIVIDITIQSLQEAVVGEIGIARPGREDFVDSV